MRHARRNIPQPYGLVVRSGSENLGIVRPGYCRYAREVAFERVLELAGSRVPYLDGAVGGGAGDPAAIVRKLYGCDALFVAAEDEGRFVV